MKPLVKAGDKEVKGYLGADYVLTGKVIAIFSKTMDGTCMIAVKDKNGHDCSTYMHFVHSSATEIIQLARTAAHLGEDVRLYGKKSDKYLSHEILALGLFYEEPKWWVEP